MSELDVSMLLEQQLSKSRKVDIKPIQQDVIDDSFEAALKYGVVINNSQTGTGKTVMTIAQMQMLREKYNKPVRMVILGPSALLFTNPLSHQKAVSPWEREGIKYGEIDNMLFFNYDLIRGTGPVVPKGRQGKAVAYSPVALYQFQQDPIPDGEFFWDENSNERERFGAEEGNKAALRRYTNYEGLLVRKDVLMTNGKYRQEYSPSKYLMHYCMDPNYITIGVLDEGHKAKNIDTLQHMASAAFVRAFRRARLLREDQTSFIYILTATPGGSEHNALAYFRLIGNSDPLDFTYPDMFIGGPAYTPFRCCRIAEEFNSALTLQIGKAAGILTEYGGDAGAEITKGKVKPALFRMWTECVLDKIRFIVPNATPKQVFNAFLIVRDAEDKAAIVEAHNDLRQAEQEGRILEEFSNIKNKVNKAMVRTMVSHAIRTHLTVDPNCRVIMAFDLIECVETAVELLTQAGYGGEIGKVIGSQNYRGPINGYDKKTHNNMVINQFQGKDITKSLRILVGTNKKLTTGLDLHDEIGGRQPWTYTVITDDITELEQLFGRTSRFNSKSIPGGYVCLPLEFGPDILGIFARNIKKSENIAKIMSLRDNAKDPMQALIYKNLFMTPGEYPRCIENDVVGTIYLHDRPTYNVHTGEAFPAPDTFGYIETNDDIGKRHYRNTSTLIQYLNEMIDDGYSLSEIPGIVPFELFGPDVMPFAPEDDDDVSR